MQKLNAAELLRDETHRAAIRKMIDGGKGHTKKLLQVASREDLAQAAEILRQRSARVLAAQQDKLSQHPPGRFATLAMERLVEKARVRLKTLWFSRDYRTASGKWAGGNEWRVTIGDTPRAYSTVTKAWSSNGKWSGSEAVFRVTVGKEFLAIPDEVHRGVLAIVTHLELMGFVDDIAVYHAAVLTQERGLQVGWKRCFICKSNGVYAPIEKTDKRNTWEAAGKHYQNQLVLEAMLAIGRAAGVPLRVRVKRRIAT